MSVSPVGEGNLFWANVWPYSGGRPPTLIGQDAYKGTVARRVAKTLVWKKLNEEKVVRWRTDQESLVKTSGMPTNVPLQRGGIMMMMIFMMITQSLWWWWWSSSSSSSWMPNNVSLHWCRAKLTTVWKEKRGISQVNTTVNKNVLGNFLENI